MQTALAAEAGMPTDQIRTSVAAGPAGAVAVGFYNRRNACPTEPSILPPDVGLTNFCIDTSLQAYKGQRQRGRSGGDERADLETPGTYRNRQ